ncbi:exported protein of unknown function [Streptomyces sp. KY70]|nr:exported protein of unknown function [Streptomyces sp. KY70]
MLVLPVLLGVLGLLAGALSSTGPVASACGTQLLVAAVVGAGMPLPEPGGERALLYLAGGGVGAGATAGAAVAAPDLRRPVPVRR